MQLFRLSFLSAILIPAIYSMNTIAANTPENPYTITTIGVQNSITSLKATTDSAIKTLSKFDAIQNVYTLKSHTIDLIKSPDYIKLQITLTLVILGKKNIFHQDSNGVYIWKGNIYSYTDGENKNTPVYSPKLSSFATYPMNSIDLYISSGGQLSGQVRVNGQLYGITSTDKNNIISFKIDASKFPEDGESTAINDGNNNNTQSYSTDIPLSLNTELPKRVSVSRPLINKNMKDTNILSHPLIRVPCGMAWRV